MKGKKIIVWVLAVCLVLAAAAYFVLPVKLDCEVTSAAVLMKGESTTLDHEQNMTLDAILEDTRATRCFAPGVLDDAVCEVNVLTSDGTLHIHFGDTSYAYTSADDAVWYRIKDADTLRTDIENLLN